MARRPIQKAEPSSHRLHVSCANAREARDYSQPSPPATDADVHQRKLPNPFAPDFCPIIHGRDLDGPAHRSGPADHRSDMLDTGQLKSGRSEEIDIYKSARLTIPNQEE